MTDQPWQWVPSAQSPPLPPSPCQSTPPPAPGHLLCPPRPGRAARRGPLSRSPRQSRGAVGDTHPAVRSCWTLSSRSRSVSSIFPAFPGCEGQRRREGRGRGSAALPPPVPPPLSPPRLFRLSTLLVRSLQVGSAGVCWGEPSPSFCVPPCVRVELRLKPGWFQG